MQIIGSLVTNHLHIIHGLDPRPPPHHDSSEDEEALESEDTNVCNEYNQQKK
jgi:hypothetical protein